MAAIKMDRIDLRVSSTDKEMLESAAASRRLSLSAYILSVVMEVAAQDLERENSINLSRQGWDNLMNLLDNPPEPSEGLMRLFNR